MFLKIQVQNTETIRECSKFDIDWANLMDSGFVTISFNGAPDDYVTVPVGASVFVMNDAGRTVDAYHIRATGRFSDRNA